MEEQIVPGDIKKDANNWFGGLEQPHKVHPIKAYIQGRLDERSKSWTDEDIIEAFENGAIKADSIKSNADIVKWFREYKQSKGKYLSPHRGNVDRK